MYAKLHITFVHLFAHEAKIRNEALIQPEQLLQNSHDRYHPFISYTGIFDTLILLLCSYFKDNLLYF